MAYCDSKNALEMEDVHHQAHNKCVYHYTFKPKFNSDARLKIVKVLISSLNGCNLDDDQNENIQI